MTRKKYQIPLPRTIKIGGRTVKILLSTKTNAKLKEDGHYGECRLATGVIRVATDCGRDALSQTALHEFLHAIDDIYNNNELGERQTNCISEGLWQVLEQLGIEFVARWW